MTTDSEAWVGVPEAEAMWMKFATALEKWGKLGVVQAARETAEWLRERQKRGDFGTPQEIGHSMDCAAHSGDPCDCKHGPSRLDAMEARALERVTDRLDLALRERDEQRTRAEAAEASNGGFARRAGDAERQLSDVQALLKEALGALGIHAAIDAHFAKHYSMPSEEHEERHRAFRGARDEVLSKAKAAGFLPGGE